MTSNQKQRISTLRARGWGYKAIAKDLGLTENCVKKYCQRNQMAGCHVKVKPDAARETEMCCLQCGQPLRTMKTGRHRKFCGDACRMAWWHSHPEQIAHKAVYAYVCPACGKAFSAYGNSRRKYCSHVCYVTSRFSAKAGVAHD